MALLWTLLVQIVSYLIAVRFAPYLIMVAGIRRVSLAEAIAAIGISLVYFMGIYTIHQVMIKFSLWRAAVESVVISGYEAFDHVRDMHVKPEDEPITDEGLFEVMSSDGG